MWFKKENGQAMVEFALVLPLLIILICGIIDFGWIFGNQLLLNSACKEATRVCSINADLSQSELTTEAQNVVIDRANSLYNNGTVSVSVDKNTGTGEITVTVTCILPMLTPLMSTIHGPTLTITSSSVMRAE